MVNSLPFSRAWHAILPFIQANLAKLCTVVIRFVFFGCQELPHCSFWYLHATSERRWPGGSRSFYPARCSTATLGVAATTPGRYRAGLFHRTDPTFLSVHILWINKSSPSACLRTSKVTSIQWHRHQEHFFWFPTSLVFSPIMSSSALVLSQNFWYKYCFRPFQCYAV